MLNPTLHLFWGLWYGEILFFIGYSVVFIYRTSSIKLVQMAIRHVPPGKTPKAHLLDIHGDSTISVPQLNRLQILHENQ